MSAVDVLDILRMKQSSFKEFQWDNLIIPPMEYFLTPQDVEQLHYIATSIRLSCKLEKKYEMIDNIMTYRGFKRFSGGTNRVVYRFYEDPRFVAKIAIDKVGMQDNPKEFRNQFLLKPYVTKMFYVSPCGTVGLAERVIPIKNKDEFKAIAGDVFEMLVCKILGKYVVEDIGTKYFMNYGLRPGMGPVLLDYPYVYKLDGKKLFCNIKDSITGISCDGEIDYDVGFNHLVCTKCGKIYLASDLRDDSEDNKIIIKGGLSNMKMVIHEADGEDRVINPIKSEDIMVRPKVDKVKSMKMKMVINTPTGRVSTDERPVSIDCEQPKFKDYGIRTKISRPDDSDTKSVPSTEAVDQQAEESNNKITQNAEDTENTVIETENEENDNPPVNDDHNPDDDSIMESYVDKDEGRKCEVVPDQDDYSYDVPPDDEPEDEDSDESEEDEVVDKEPPSLIPESNGYTPIANRTIIAEKRQVGGPKVGSSFIKKTRHKSFPIERLD